MNEEQVNRQVQLIEDATDELCKSKQKCIDFLLKLSIKPKQRR